MKKHISLLLCLACSVFLMAAKKKDPEPTPMGPFVTEQECAALTAYTPSAGTEYQPGVDVHGKPVMPADVTPSTVVKLPEKFSFDVTIDVAKHMGLSVPAGLAGEAKIGTITSDKGRLEFNGSPLNPDAAAALKALCASQKTPKPSPK